MADALYAGKHACLRRTSPEACHVDIVSHVDGPIWVVSEDRQDQGSVEGSGDPEPPSEAVEPVGELASLAQYKHVLLLG